jgi:phosphoglycerol transferase MdoB-like AlkP superfamily enzyme
VSSSGTSARDERAPYRRSDRHRKKRGDRGGYVDLFLPALIVLALAKALLSRGLGLGSANPLGVLAELSAIVLILGAVDLVWPKRRSYTLDLVVYSALCLVMLANVMYVSFFGEIFSPRLLSVLGQAGEVSDSIQAILKPVYLLYLIDIPILAAWAALSWRVRRRRAPRDRRPVAIVTGVALLIVVVQVAFILGLSADTDGTAVALVRGFGPYQVASVVRMALPDPADSAASAFAHEKNLTPAQAAQAQIDAIRKANTGARIGTTKVGQYAGKNVIVIQVEALQDLVINKSYAGHQITPQLNKLVGESWYFPNTYSQTSAGNTVDAEFAVNTSLYPPTAGAASLLYSDRELPGLPRLLRAKGYDAITLHQNDVRFWNRKELYPALGFRKYWDRSYFQLRDKMWHASDQILFSYGMKVLKSEAASSAPFYSFFITESSHAPYKAIPMARRPLQFDPAQEKTFSGMYVGSISYTDKAIGEFVDSLKTSGLWDKSIIVIYGDHSALLDKGVNAGDSKVADTILGRPYSDIDRQRIPLIVHLPGQTKAEVSEKPVGQVDIMPTIADLVGLDLSQVPHVGRSAFVDAPSLIPTRAYLPGGSFIDDNALFMPGLGFDDGKAISVTTGQPVTPGAAEREGYSASKRLGLISDAWVKSLPIRPDAAGTKGAIIPR